MLVLIEIKSDIQNSAYLVKYAQLIHLGTKYAIPNIP